MKPVCHELTRACMQRAVSELKHADPVLAAWMERVGPKQLKRPASRYTVLLHSIVAQQISARAADTVLGRVHALKGLSPIPKPEEVLAWYRTEQTRAVIQGCGLSGQKLKYVEALSRAFVEGDLHGYRWSRHTDAEVVEILTRINGIGRWTAEMFLIFGLRRPDVFAPGDLALRNGLMRVTGREGLSPVECDTIAERWKPWRSVASLYLWRIAHWGE